MKSLRLIEKDKDPIMHNDKIIKALKDYQEFKKIREEIGKPVKKIRDTNKKRISKHLIDYW